MGVDYSVTVGFGLVKDTDSLSKFSTFFEDYEGEKWLAQNSIEYIDYSLCGNHMSGETFGLFGVGIKRYDIDGLNIHETLTKPKLTAQTFNDFKKIQHLLGLKEQPEWHLFLNIS